jgi:hypothetical protein
MMEEDQEKIRELAHKLWEQAGKPEGKEDQFWFEARAPVSGRAHTARAEDPG